MSGGAAVETLGVNHLAVGAGFLGTASRVESPFITALEQRLHSGSICHDQAQLELFRLLAAGTPVLEDCPEEPDQQIATFLHYDQEAEDVLLFINRITDEKNLYDALMQPIKQTHFRSISYQMKKDWLASYCFIPTYPGQQHPWQEANDRDQLQTALSLGYADDFNPRQCLNGLGNMLSVVELEQAPAQDYLPQGGQPRLESAPGWQLGPGQQLLSLIEVGTPAAEDPTLLVFDGELWEFMGLPAMLRAAFLASKINALHLVLLDSITLRHQLQQLAGTGLFSAYLADDLLPWLRKRGLASCSEKVILCGQSLGASLSLLFALERPEACGAVISQSAWLCYPGLRERLDFLKRSGQLWRLGHLGFEIEVGLQERLLEPLHWQLVQELKQSPASLNYRVFNGGHDYACWRGTIVPALARLCNLEQNR